MDDGLRAMLDPADYFKHLDPTGDDARYSALWPARSRHLAILDTDHLMNDLREHVTRARSGTLGARLSGRLCYAASHIYTEMYRGDAYGHENKFHKLAVQSRKSDSPLDANQLRHAFEEDYLPILRFVDMTGVLEDHPWGEICDPDDAPTARLAALLSAGRPVVYSRDHSLRTPGLAPKNLGPALAAQLAVDGAEGIFISAAWAGVATVGGVHAGVKAVTTPLRVHPAVGWAVLVGLLCWVLWKPSRRGAAREFLAPIGRQFLLEMERGEQGRARLAELAVPEHPEMTLIGRVAVALAFAPRPVTMAELLDAFRDDEESEIEEVLRSNACFVHGKTGWQLGRQLAPLVEA